MQTFLPYRDFARSAWCLDPLRLANQRNEALTILRSLLYGTGWSNHPATLMWEDYAPALVHYGMEVCLEAKRRGIGDTVCDEFADECDYNKVDLTQWELPHWLTRDFCLRHRSNLLRKDLYWYRRFGWDVPTDLPYSWPCH
jgi:hypothetical protein